MSVLWQGNAISTMKTFGGLNCALCMKERLHILNGLEKDKTAKKKLLINSSNELYSACRHKPDFHRYQICQPVSTDEELLSNSEKSNSETDTQSPMSLTDHETDQNLFGDNSQPSPNNDLSLVDRARESNGYRVMDL